MPGLKDLWIMSRNATAGGAVIDRIEEYELRFDFDNDRHHAVGIPAGATAAHVGMKLHDLAFAIERDRKLG
jgi:hypothetical protein